MSLGIISYKYTYGAGNAPNRVIQFQRENESEPKTVFATIYALSAKIPAGKRKISEILGNQINVEGMTTTQKMENLRAERLGQTYVEIPDKKLSELTAAEQVDRLSHLEPKGLWRISIINDIGDTPFFEKVRSIVLFNPT